jgi:hypothetical protein
MSNRATTSPSRYSSPAARARADEHRHRQHEGDVRPVPLQALPGGHGRVAAGQSTRVRLAPETLFTFSIASGLHVSDDVKVSNSPALSLK